MFRAVPGQVVTPVDKKRLQGERRGEEKEEKLLRNGERKDEEESTGGGGGLRKETYTVSSPSLYLRERSSRRPRSPQTLFNGAHMREFERPQVPLTFSLLSWDLIFLIFCRQQSRQHQVPATRE